MGEFESKQYQLSHILLQNSYVASAYKAYAAQQASYQNQAPEQKIIGSSTIRYRIVNAFTSAPVTVISNICVTAQEGTTRHRDVSTRARGQG